MDQRFLKMFKYKFNILSSFFFLLLTSCSGGGSSKSNQCSFSSNSHFNAITPVGPYSYENDIYFSDCSYKLVQSTGCEFNATFQGLIGTSGKISSVITSHNGHESCGFFREISGFDCWYVVQGPDTFDLSCEYSASNLYGHYGRVRE